MSEILNALTIGIGKDLGTDIRRSFYELSKIIHNDDIFSTYPIELQQFLDDVLCLSIYNQKVMIPINGAFNFKNDTAQYGVKKIRMSKLNCDKEFFIKIGNINRQFYALTHSFQIDIEKLLFSSKKDFFEYWTNFYEQHK